MRILLVVLLAPTLATAGCTGCFKTASAVTVDPAEPCLELRIGSPGDPAVCGDPDLTVTNHCADALALPPGSVDPQPAHTVTVAPGQQAVYAVRGYTSDGGAHYQVPAMLGSMAITIAFTTSDR